ncbi:MAG: Asp-tRNA(Asn)/Glu-tRNA(Gln) amidotransferase subunit GatB [Halobacteria archaeon]
MSRDFEVVIGLEIHVQLDTETKMFCGCSADYGDDEPNTHVCPVCLGLPGSLPVVNERAVEYAVKIGKALDCDIQRDTRFHRKNYFYPDLPKNFQITQYDEPINRDGEVTVEVEDDERDVGIKRAHMEEDPGSMVHKGGSIERAQYTLIDYNRSGTPLMEIVTEPDITTPEEARALVVKLREILEYLDVFDVERAGALRVDANISISEDGEEGTRTEVKNIGSTKGVEKALRYEITRQKNQLKRGGEVTQETRHYDDDRGITVTLREKVGEKDYRYFQERDIPPLDVDDLVEEVEIPELPEERRERFGEEYGLSGEMAEKLTSRKAVADLFEDVAEEVSVSAASTWIADELLRELNYRDLDVGEVDVDEFLFLLSLVEDDEITDRNAVDVLRTNLDEDRSPREIVEDEGMLKAGEDEASAAVESVLEENGDAVDDYLSGDEGSVNYLVGQVMQETGGSADPGDVNRILREKLNEIEPEQ